MLRSQRGAIYSYRLKILKATFSSHVCGVYRSSGATQSLASLQLILSYGSVNSSARKLKTDYTYIAGKHIQQTDKNLVINGTGRLYVAAH
jgi:hypothetical protein